MTINIPITDIEDIARVMQQVRRNPMHDPGPFYLAVSEDRMELRQGTNISYGTRLFKQVDPKI